MSPETVIKHIARTELDARRAGTKIYPRNLMTCGFMFYQNEVVLVTKAGRRVKWQAGLLNGVGGGVEAVDQNLYETQVREFNEETGVTTHHADWEPFCYLTHGNDWGVMMFKHRAICRYNLVADAASGEPVDWYSATHLLGRQFASAGKVFVPNLAWLLPMAMSDGHYAVVEDPRA